LALLRYHDLFNKKTGEFKAIDAAIELRRLFAG
jgi:hypothetical protein